MAFVGGSLAAKAELKTKLAFGGGSLAATAKLERTLPFFEDFLTEKAERNAKIACGKYFGGVPPAAMNDWIYSST